jgi:hypothetical protein
MRTAFWPVSLAGLSLDARLQPQREPLTVQQAYAAFVQPFEVAEDVGRYWLTRSLTREPTGAWVAFRDWLVGQVATGPAGDVKG